MEKLQNNFTTPEQSKRLLELGVPANSADCWLTMSDEIFEDRHRPHVRTRGYETADSFFELRAKSILPCWSVGRLIEIIMRCHKYDILFFSSIRIYRTDILYNTLIDDLIKYMSVMDFSKLEDCA